jgi:hypothetical protein
MKEGINGKGSGVDVKEKGEGTGGKKQRVREMRTQKLISIRKKNRI